MEFSKQFMQDLVYEDYDDKDLEIIEDTLKHTSRWSEHHTIIFKKGDKYYISYYSRGLTEMQDEQPYEYDDDIIKCVEVVPVEKTIIAYVRKEK